MHKFTYSAGHVTSILSSNDCKVKGVLLTVVYVGLHHIHVAAPSE